MKSINLFFRCLLAISLIFGQSTWAGAKTTSKFNYAKVVSDLNRNWNIDDVEKVLLARYPAKKDQIAIKRDIKKAKKDLGQEKPSFTLGKNNKISMHLMEKKRFELSFDSAKSEIIWVNGKKLSLAGESYKKTMKNIAAILQKYNVSMMDLLLPKANAVIDKVGIAIVFVSMLILAGVGLSVRRERHHNKFNNKRTIPLNEAAKDCHKNKKNQSKARELLTNIINNLPHESEKDVFDNIYKNNCSHFVSGWRTNQYEKFMNDELIAKRYCTAIEDISWCVHPKLFTPERTAEILERKKASLHQQKANEMLSQQ